MRWTFLGLLTVACAAASGCSHNHYQVRMTPKDGGFERTITFWQEDGSDTSKRGPANDEEQARIQKCYDGTAKVGDQGERTFHGSFEQETPGDIGGAGRLERLETSLGTAWFYVERFRGNDDPAGELAHRQEAIDKAVDLLLGWLEKELGSEPGYPRLRTFVDEQFRHDLKNLAVSLWAAPLNGETIGEDGVVERLWLYLRQRDYVTPHDLAVIGRSMATEDPTLGLRPLARIVARELDVSPESDALAVFRDPKRLEKSMDAYLRDTEFYTQFVSEWQASHQEAKPEEVPGPGDAFGEMFSEAFPLFDGEPNDVVDLVLDIPCKPISTNGKWDETTKSVNWKLNLGTPQPLSIVCSALWATPNKEEQKRRFGKVVLDGDGLVEYALWHESLSADEVTQWEPTLAKCQGGENWQAIVKSFRFQQESDTATRLADQLKGWLNLEEEKGKKEEE